MQIQVVLIMSFDGRCSREKEFAIYVLYLLFHYNSGTYKLHSFSLICYFEYELEIMWKKQAQFILVSIRSYSRISPPPPAVIRVSEKNVAHLGPQKVGPKPRQLLCLPPFPGHNLPGKNWGQQGQVTAISWVKYYFDEVQDSVIQSHFNKGLVSIRFHCYIFLGGY